MAEAEADDKAAQLSPRLFGWTMSQCVFDWLLNFAVLVMTPSLNKHLIIIIAIKIAVYVIIQFFTV